MTTLRLLLFGILIIISPISVNGAWYDTINNIWGKTKSIASSVGGDLKGKCSAILTQGKSTLTKTKDIFSSVGTDLKTTCNNILADGSRTLTKTGQVLSSVGSNLGVKTLNVLNSVGDNLEGKTLNVLGDTGNILTSIGTNLKGTCNNILNDGEQTLIKTGNILTSVGNDVEGKTLNAWADTQNILNSIGNNLQGTTQNVLNDAQNIWNKMEKAMDDSINVLKEKFGDIATMTLEKKEKIDKIKESFNDLSRIFGKNEIDLLIINPILDIAIAGMIESGVIKNDLIDTFIRTMPMITRTADIVINELEFFKNTNFDVFPEFPPSINGTRRRRLIDLMNENDASYTTGSVYNEMIDIMLQNGGFIDNTIPIFEAKRLYTDGNVYQQYNIAKTVLQILLDYLETSYDLADRLTPDGREPCSVDYVTPYPILSTAVAAYVTGIWIIDLFLDAADIHDDILQTTQIDKIFKDQTVIINNLEVNHNKIASLNEMVKTISDAHNISISTDNIISPPDAINYNINVIIICSTFIISLLLILLIVFIKGYFNRNNQYKYKYKQIDVDTTDSEIDIDHDNKK